MSSSKFPLPGIERGVGDLFRNPQRAPVLRTGEREPISDLVRQLVYRRDGWTCQRCSARPWAADPDRESGALHLDHIVPWSAMGSDRSDNLRTLCGPCNQARSNFVSDSDRSAIPCVRICTPCLATTDDRFAAIFDKPAATFEVYCGSNSHFGWAVPGWRIL